MIGAIDGRLRRNFRPVALIGGALALSSALPADAADVPELLAAKRCNACHETHATLLGPPYAAIAARHRTGDDGIVATLAHKIVLGGGGTWGVVPMVPNEHVTLEEAQTMVRWILALEPAQ
jgi:cytochrome c